MMDRDADAAQVLGRTDPGKLQDMRRVDGTGGEDHFALRVHALERSAALVLDRDGAATVEDDAVYLRFDDDLKVGPLQRWPQIGARGAGAATATPCLLAPADAVAGTGRQVVDVLAVFEADLLTSLDYRCAKRRPVHLRGKERTAPAANLGLAALPVLGLFKEGQDLVPAPAAIAKLGPVVEILGLTADINQPVDRAGPAEHPAARVQDRAPGSARIGLGVISPSQGRVIEHLHKAGRDVNVRAPITPARFDQSDSHVRVLGQAVGQNAPRRAGADDHIIGLHAMPSRYCAASAVIKLPSSS